MLLCYPHPSPGSYHFSKEPWLFPMDNGIMKSHNLGARYVHCYWGAAAAKQSPWGSWRRYVHTTHLHLHARSPHTYIKDQFITLCTRFWLQHSNPPKPLGLWLLCIGLPHVEPLLNLMEIWHPPHGLLLFGNTLLTFLWLWQGTNS